MNAGRMVRVLSRQINCTAVRSFAREETLHVNDGGDYGDDHDCDAVVESSGREAG